MFKNDSLFRISKVDMSNLCHKTNILFYWVLLVPGFDCILILPRINKTFSSYFLFVRNPLREDTWRLTLLHGSGPIRLRRNYTSAKMSSISLSHFFIYTEVAQFVCAGYTSAKMTSISLSHFFIYFMDCNPLLIALSHIHQDFFTGWTSPIRLRCRNHHFNFFTFVSIPSTIAC